jgi:hypothetical protein
MILGEETCSVLPVVATVRVEDVLLETGVGKPVRLIVELNTLLVFDAGRA